jgi:hypothetical protein
MSEQSEQPRRRRRQPPPATPAGQGSAARGAILVAVAVVIGVLLLRDDDSATTQVAVGSDTAADVDSSTGMDVDDEGEDAEATTTTTQPLRDPAEVKVLVANGSGVDGAAGGATDALEALGYVTATPANADRVESTIVYFTTGFQAEAEALAVAIGAPPESVTQMPAVAPVDDLQLANVLVHLGPDLVASG